MKVIKFEPRVNGVLRVAVPRDKVKGYRHSSLDSDEGSIHYYRRGNICYIFDNISCAGILHKFDYSKAMYCELTYKDFNKFIRIVNAEEV